MRADYRKGFEDGITAFAWWKDGVQMVGTTGKTLAMALEQLEEIYGFNPTPEKQLCLKCRRPLVTPAIDGLCATCRRSPLLVLDPGAPPYHDGTLSFQELSAENSEIINRICGLAQIGAEWCNDSSLEKWFPITAEELSKVKANYGQIYALVETYLTTPNTAPDMGEAYHALVAWFVRNKRPDGTEPFPVSPEQELL